MKEGMRRWEIEYLYKILADLRSTGVGAKVVVRREVSVRR